MDLITWLPILFTILGVFLAILAYFHNKRFDTHTNQLILEKLRLDGNELLRVKTTHLLGQNDYVDRGLSLIGTHTIGSITWQCYQCTGTSSGNTCDYCSSPKKVL